MSIDKLEVKNLASWIESDASGDHSAALQMDTNYLSLHDADYVKAVNAQIQMDSKANSKIPDIQITDNVTNASIGFISDPFWTVNNVKLTVDGQAFSATGDMDKAGPIGYLGTLRTLMNWAD